jgi:hypothetical protein
MTCTTSGHLCLKHVYISPDANKHFLFIHCIFYLNHKYVNKFYYNLHALDEDQSQRFKTDCNLLGIWFKYVPKLNVKMALELRSCVISVDTNGNVLTAYRLFLCPKVLGTRFSRRKQVILHLHSDNETKPVIIAIIYCLAVRYYRPRYTYTVININSDVYMGTIVLRINQND